MDDQQHYLPDHTLDELPANEWEDVEIELLIEGLFRAYGYDFRHYLRSSLRRRIRNRMYMDGVPTVTGMLEKILHEPDYVQKLTNDFSIKVTEMFRDPSFFRAFRERAVPLLDKLPEIRIWHAGCSTGEEVYSMAILLQEQGLLGKARIYATDMSERAIEQAKEGKFPLKRMQTFTKNYLQAGGTKEFSAYYTADRDYAIFDRSLAQHMMFAQHNLATDSTFNEFHVILCRNVMIYFNPELQGRVHRLFHESLTEAGILGLGSMEYLIAPWKQHYEELADGERLFVKKD
ncbi:MULTISPECIES: protein-glutamate O-methyltransferase CheR [unclassified Paenibacillus]|uniref:CheR family methyltransferase n=1 Tax=unclassified Paenibacillus TaxID=185978 RepID=UPI0010E39525|nr:MULTISPECIES: protein-glutamate O-methyltransferase CheR [unclassified Paenibacillus]NIK67152.1 chemotaxis protein methyltransferase CheR [Paenibacillus sp. BK720]TCN01197.1 chemotaxis protein methyltransferase CheR [Paenibacillus sp. BK033]